MQTGIFWGSGRRAGGQSVNTRPRTVGVAKQLVGCENAKHG